MLRARDLLTVTLPAALLALAVQPLLDSRAPAQGSARPVAPVEAADAGVAASAKGDRLVIAREAEPNVAPNTRRAEETPTPVVRPRPRVGCEGAISALAGQEARRLLPSRCLV